MFFGWVFLCACCFLSSLFILRCYGGGLTRGQNEMSVIIDPREKNKTKLIFKKEMNLVSINLTVWSTLPVCPNAVCFVIRAVLKGLTIKKNVFDIWVCIFCFMFVWGLILSIGFRKGLKLYT